MKRIFLCLIVFFVASQLWAQNAQNTKMDWWKEAKFGMFIHWGLYSHDGCYYKGKDGLTEHMMRHLQIPLADYAKIADDFNPVKFDANQWVTIAKNAGMIYLVITAKHHDGFAMYNSPSSEYDITRKTPFRRDPVKELAEACARQGLRFGVYYSLGRDWQDPDAYTKDGRRSNTWDYPEEDKKDFGKYLERKVKPQLRELLTQYGPIAVLWFDTPESINAKHSEELVELIHSIQPACIINSRVGNKLGEYEVSEQEIPESGDIKPWETCMNFNNHWGYKKNDEEWKPTRVLLENLIDIASKGGNFLLNVGPTGEGLIPQPSVDRLQEIGRWIETHGESVYGTSSGPLQKQVWGRTTMKSDKGHTKVYLHLFEWPKDNKLEIPLKNRTVKATILNQGKKLKAACSGSSIIIALPPKPDGDLIPVIALEFKEKPLIQKSQQQKSGEVKYFDKFY
jgi:alpha-L-fucosidase